MGWFRRRKPRGEMPGPIGLVSGLHRSPGLSVLCEAIDQRHPDAILDLGPSSNENLSFLSRYCEHITIQDVARSSAGDISEARSAPLVLGAEDLVLPEEKNRYDVVLVWDLLHYIEPARRKTFVGRIARLCRPRALIFFHASAAAPIPMIPVQFKITGRERLVYCATGEKTVRAPHITPREMELLWDGFSPVRLFQLRNGMQEFLFRYEPPEPEVKDAPAPEVQDEVRERVRESRKSAADGTPKADWAPWRAGPSSWREGR